MSLPISIYGYANHEDVELAIQGRMRDVNPDSKEAISTLLGEAVFALTEINSAIPVMSKHRHLIANALERFANGPSAQDTHTES